MTASDYVKQVTAGRLNLTKVSALSCTSRQTLNNWYNENPTRFEVVVAGCDAVAQRDIVK